MTYHDTNGHNGAAQPMDAEQFGSYIEKRLSLYDQQIQLLDRDDFVLDLLVNERTARVNLQPFYEAYLARPKELDAVVHTLVRVLLGDMSVETDHEYAALADRVFPMLKPITLLAEVTERNLPMLAYRDFLADLIITYVINQPRSLAYVTEQHLDTWGISLQELHEQAIENLGTRTTQQVQFTTVGDGDQQLFVFNSGDGFDASRLLLSDVLAAWAEETPGTMVIGIPNRDFLVAFSDVDGDTLRSLAHQIQSDSAQRANGLTDQLFSFVDGQIQEYEWE